MQDLDDMIPFERELYIDMIVSAMKEEKELQSAQQ
jgi:hypothetical protein